MVKRAVLLAGAALVALTAAAPARAADSVAVIVKATTSEYWQWVFKGAEAAGKELGVKVEELGSPKDDAAAQISILEGAAGESAAVGEDRPAGHVGIGAGGALKSDRQTRVRDDCPVGVLAARRVVKICDPFAFMWMPSLW